MQVAWAVSGALLLAAVALGGLAMITPATTPGTPGTTQRSMTVGYTASVGESVAYDTTVVSSPDPVYRRVTDDVTMAFAYTGQPGALEVSADLTTTNGWHSRLPPLLVQQVLGDGQPISAQLDLAGLQARADAAAAVIGIPATESTLTLTATVSTPDGHTFGTPVRFRLTPLLFAPTDGDTLTVTDVQQGAAPEVPRTLGAGVLTMDVGAARWFALVLLAVGIVAAVLSGRLTRRTPPLDEAGQIRRRHGSVLAEVRPMVAPTDRHIVDVTDFSTMAKLARRVGLLVMHWTRSGVHTYLLIDDTTAYRYRHGGPDARDGDEPSMTDLIPPVSSTAPVAESTDR